MSHLGYWLIPLGIALVCILILYLDDRRERRKYREKAMERLR